MIINIKTLNLTEDRYNEIIELYSIFSKIDKNILTICSLKTLIKNLAKNHHILFYTKGDKIIGAITLLIEQKIIHNGKCVGHIEDFAVLEEYRSLGIGSLLLEHAIILSRQNNCYKCILDCSPSIEGYYLKKGFANKGTYMGLYF